MDTQEFAVRRWANGGLETTRALSGPIEVPENGCESLRLFGMTSMGVMIKHPLIGVEVQHLRTPDQVLQRYQRYQLIHHGDASPAMSQAVSRETWLAIWESTGQSFSARATRIDSMKADSRRSDRSSLFLVVAATLFGFLLRLWPFGRLGLNQFDEGIYAMAATWALQPGGLSSLNSILIPYAPPGFPLFVGWTYWLLGFSDQAGILVSALTGMATILVVAWTAASIFGRREAAVVSWCVCCAGPHIAFSRMGLTDASFLFFWAVGFRMGISFLILPGLSRGIVLGASVGFCQQFKYNGWLLGALVAAAALLEVIVAGPGLRTSKLIKFGGWGGLAILVAAVVVLPWFLYVQQHGGYSALLDHQRSYLGEFSQWPVHFLAQVNQATALNGPLWLGCVNGVGLLGAGLLGSPLRLADGRWAGGRSACKLLLLIPLCSAPVTTGILACLFAVNWAQVGERFLCVAWIIFMILSPLYHPYARLWLPFEMFQWLLLGSIASRLLVVNSLEWRGAPDWRRRGLVGGLAIVAGGYCVTGLGFPFAQAGPLDRPGLFAPSDSLRSAADAVMVVVPQRARSLRTLVRPSMAFYLAGRISIEAQANLAQLGRSDGDDRWALVDSTILSSDVSPLDDQPRRRVLGPILNHWEVVASIPASNTLPTTLDLDPGYAQRPPDVSVGFFWLLRSRPTEPTR